MRMLRNEDGVALVTALMFTLLSLGMIMMLLYYVNAGTRMSAAQKRYRTSVEASYGGTDFATRTVLPRLMDGILKGTYGDAVAALQADFGDPSKPGYLGFLVPDPTTLQAKLSNSTSSPAWNGLSTLSKTVNPKDAPDVTITLNGSNSGTYKVYTKIVDTVAGVGLVDASGIDYLDGGVGVAGSSSSTATPRTPNIYSIEVQGESAVNPKEKAALSVLYAY